MKTIGLDFDGMTLRSLVRKIVQAKNLAFVERIALFRTRKGYHIKLGLKEEIDLLKHFVIRALIGDDAYRIRFSLKRLYLEEGEGFDVLFDMKEDEGKVTERIDISGIVNLIDTRKEIDEIEKDVESKVELEEIDYFMTVFPLYKNELEAVVEQLEKIEVKDYFIKYALSERDEFFLVFRNLHSSKQAFAKGMEIKEKIQTKRRTFWIKKVNYLMIKGLK